MAKSGVSIPDGHTLAVRQLQIRLIPEQRQVLDLLFASSRALYNQALYVSRTAFFQTGRLPRKGSLFLLDDLRVRGFRDKPARKRPGTDDAPVIPPKPHPWTVALNDRLPGGYLESLDGSVHRKVLPASVADQVLWSVHEAWESYRGLRTLFSRGELPYRPRPPGYLKPGTGFKLAYPNSGGGKPKLKGVLDETTGELVPSVRFPLGDTCAAWFGLSELVIPLPLGIDPERVREWTFRRQNGTVILELCFLKEKPSLVPLDPDLMLAIDPGTSCNLAACVGTDGSNLLIDARQLKSMNQGYNRLIARRKQGKAEDYWDERCDRLTLKRNNRMRDGINKAAKLIVQHCLDRGIGTVVFGWNTGIKQKVNLGRKENQKFVQMPLARLKERVRQLCELHAVQFVEQEESYTSKSSYLDGDTPPVHGQVPAGWTASGRRLRRGLYRTKTGLLVNADLNGAANILSKHVARTPVSDQPVRLGRRCLTTARRTRLWCVSASVS